MPRLIVMRTPGITEQVVPRAPDMKIGRAAANDLVLDSGRVSRFHAVLSLDGPTVSITDLGSRNGTYVNGARIRSCVLVDGDSISIGACQIRFVVRGKAFSDSEALRLMDVDALLAEQRRWVSTSGTPVAGGF